MLELSDTTDDAGVPALDLAGLASEEDIADLAAEVAPGTSAAILVVELLWAKAFAGALFDAGGAVLARQRHPRADRQRIPVRVRGLKERIMMRRRGRPGLVGMAARTAVVAGTATAVSGAVAGHQADKANQAAQAQAYEAQQQQAAMDAAAAQAVANAQAARRRLHAAAPAGGGSDLMTQLNQLGALHAQGILSDEEFSAAKAKLLS